MPKFLNYSNPYDDFSNIHVSPKQICCLNYFRTRCKEHMRDANPKNSARLENNDVNNKSALVKHVYSKNHHIDWNNSKILAKKTDNIRRFLESFFIHSNNDAFNVKPIVFIQLLIII